MATSRCTAPFTALPRRIASPAGVFLSLISLLALISVAAASDFRPYRVRALTDASFEHDTQASSGQTTGRWFVLFATSDCLTSADSASPCHRILASLKEAASAADDVPGRLFIAAQVDVDANPKLKKRFGVGSEPVLKLFRDRAMFSFPQASLPSLISRHGMGGGLDDTGEEVDEEFEGEGYAAAAGGAGAGGAGAAAGGEGDLAAVLRRFVRGSYKEVGEEKVPGEPTAMDGIVELLASAWEQYQAFMRVSRLGGTAKEGWYGSGMGAGGMTWGRGGEGGGKGGGGGGGEYREVGEEKVPREPTAMDGLFDLLAGCGSGMWERDVGAGWGSGMWERDGGAGWGSGMGERDVGAGWGSGMSETYHAFMRVSDGPESSHPSAVPGLHMAWEQYHAFMF
ncbi:unnamed protein product [Closterium sp. Naga37s-1]|nr:unnamed protein product [Closterium sp. Naga37s-1]